MKKIVISLAFIFIGGNTVCLAALKRSEGYFGVHLDFHAVKENDRIGETVTEAMVQEVIDAIKPDYIQVDSKGHPGYSSYPTRVGRQTGGYVKDQLQIWRQVTRANDIPLVVHYSTLYDEAALRDNPEWGVMLADGTRHDKYASIFSPIAQELIIPQIKELRADYGVDAVWCDGECWGVQADYGPQARQLFQSQQGNIEIPSGPDDEKYHEYLEMHRQKYREFLAGYVNELHAFDENLEIASNWTYSSYMPERCTIDVDWLSGDLPAADSLNAARLETRCLRLHGKNWDLMSWGFANKNGSILNTKTPVQLQQEAASVIAQGGGFQVYFTQRPDGSVRQWQIDQLKDVAAFCRDRQPFCEKARPVVQTAVLLSTEAVYRKGASYERVFGAWGSKQTGGMAPVKGIVKALCESQVVFDFMLEHQILENLRQLELIIIPEWSWMDPAFKAKLVEYAQDGGSLLVIGAQSSKLFEQELGVTFTSEPQKDTRWLGFNNTYACYMNNNFIPVQAGRSRTIGTVSPLELPGYAKEKVSASPDSFPAATVAALGKGRIAGIHLDFGQNYLLVGNSNSRDFMKAVVDELLPQPMVKVEGSHAVDVVVNRVRGKLAVNLVNTSGPHADTTIHVFDEVPPVGPLKVSIKTGRKPGSIRMQPDDVRLKYKQEGDYSVVTVPRLELHQIIVVE